MALPLPLASTTSITTPSTAPPTPRDIDSERDPFDILLDLESAYEARGYTDGLHDGKAQALSSSTLFGIEKGFEKYIVMSRLRFRAEKWARAFDVHVDHNTPAPAAVPVSSSVGGVNVGADANADMAPAAQGAGVEVGTENSHVHSRLQKHTATLLKLTSAQTMDYANTDEAIGDFEERLKRAQAKCKVIERMVGTGDPGAVVSKGNGEIEDPRLNLKALRLGGERDF